jgi:MYXO-CTERM domain-containing protein
MFCKVLVCSVVAIAATHASADLVNPEVPTWRGDAGAQFYGWDSFSSAYGAPNYNDTGDGNAMVFNFAESAIITGSDNIYNQAGGLNIHVYGYGSIDQAVLNFASMGTEMDYAGVYLYVADGETGDGEMFSYDTLSTNYYEEVPNFGANVSASYTWDLSGHDGVITEWAFFINGVSAHNVLDAVSVDILAGGVPAPGALALLGLAGLAQRRRR